MEKRKIQQKKQNNNSNNIKLKFKFEFKFKLMVFILFFIFFSFGYATAEDIDDEFDLDYEPSGQESTLNIWDPFEKYNRKIFDFNVWFLKNVAHPVYSKAYVKVTTKGMRKSINNFVSNLYMPFTCLNYFLQLNFREGTKSLYSFLLNSTIGLLGFFNPAGYQEVLPDKTSLSITLAKYHIPAGPYIMWPFLGPSDLRGSVSMATETLINPLSYNVLDFTGEHYIFGRGFDWTQSAFSVADGVTMAVEGFYDLLSNSFDPYSLAKTAYEQNLNYKIKKVRGE